MSWRAFLLVLLLPSLVWAQSPPIVAVPPGDDKIVPLEEGDKAPYTGQLFDPTTALRWANWLQQYKYRLKWDVEKEQSICAVEKKYRDDLLSAEEKRAATVEKDLRARLLRSEKARLKAEEEARNPDWYNTRTFGVAVGVVATVGIVALSVWALSAVTK